jgi:alkanesulfonate monooxygenase SsuD/methylene tetrahydromethanopterin reductase-like flavin-dependent oxidoreductase (luciferase family)
VATPPHRPRIVAWAAVSDASVAGPAALDAARELDRAGVDLLVLDQVPGTARLDPVPVLTAVARVTRRIGLVAGLPVADQPPYLLARALGTLDLVSGGRAGWLVDENRPAADVRDDTARWQDAATAPEPEWAMAVAEHVDTACALWNSWEPDAVVIDRATGVFVDHTRVHTVDARGRFFSSRGPLNNPAPPQGRPVLLGAAEVGAGGRRSPAAAVDVVVVRAGGADEAAELVAHLRAQGPALVLVAVTADVEGSPAPVLDRTAVRVRGSAATVAAEVSRLVEMTGADGVVLHGSLEVRAVAGTASALAAEWDGFPEAGGHLRDRLLAFAPVGGAA